MESETVQFWIPVLRKRCRRKWVEDSAEPASFFRGRDRSGFLAESLCRNCEQQSKAGGAVSHERVKQQTLQILSNPLSIDHEDSLGDAGCLRSFAPDGGSEKSALHVSLTHRSEPTRHDSLLNFRAGAILGQRYRH